jgi:hypothetical protein
MSARVVITSVQSATYWSATTMADHPESAWFVVFGAGGVAGSLNKINPGYAWCVRGGMQADVY